MLKTTLYALDALFHLLNGVLTGVGLATVLRFVYPEFIKSAKLAVAVIIFGCGFLFVFNLCHAAIILGLEGPHLP